MLNAGCLPYAVGKQPSIPLINHGRTWTLTRNYYISKGEWQQKEHVVVISFFRQWDHPPYYLNARILIPATDKNSDRRAWNFHGRGSRRFPRHTTPADKYAGEAPRSSDVISTATTGSRRSRACVRQVKCRHASQPVLVINSSFISSGLKNDLHSTL